MDLKTLYNISYGVYIVSSKKAGKFNGQIANTVFQVTSEPPTIAISINKQNLTHQYIQESKFFSVSILSREAPIKFIGQFGFKSGRQIDKFKDIKYKISSQGVPIVIENAIGYVEAEVINSVDAGTHTLFIGKIVDAEVFTKAEPMTYAYYHTVKQGTSPKTAPTYIKPETAPKPKAAPEPEAAPKPEVPLIPGLVTKPEVAPVPKNTASKYRCTVCNYVYDSAKGDPDNGIKPGTQFEKIPDNWVCPICGADKESFTKEG